MADANPEDGSKPAGRMNRRRLLRLAAGAPFGAFAVAACGSKSRPIAPEHPGQALATVEPTPPPVHDEPFVVAAGEERRLMMAGTPQETPAYIFGSGQPGKIVMALGGVHGNEPGGWLAADRLLSDLRPARGAFLIIPHANKLAMASFVRTTDALGDLNRLYPGDANGLPMAQMAAQIIALLREFHVDVVVDMHESWSFYNGRPQNGTAYLGQTVTSNQAEAASALARGVVESVNTRMKAPVEELFYRDFPSNRQLQQDVPPGQGIPAGQPTLGNGVNTSSLGIPRELTGVAAILVEMGQQQPLERRVAIHVDIFQEMARRLQVIDA